MTNQSLLAEVLRAGGRVASDKAKGLRLDLARAEIDDAFLGRLIALPEIIALDVSGTRVTDGGIAL